MKKILFLLIGILAFIFSNCSTDKPSNDGSQDAIETLKAEQVIGKYVQKTIFNSFPKYSIEDYGAYFYTIEKNNKLWLVEYNLHERKGFVYSQINSIENGICKMEGYWEGTDWKGNTIHGDGPPYVVDFSKQGIIASNQGPNGFVFYY
jgi:hypothetical protein